MSRTYRRKKGYRPYDSAHYKDECLHNWFDGWCNDEERFERNKLEFHMDGKWDSGRWKNIKWHTNYVRRAQKRMDLVKVYKAHDYDDLDIYPRIHDYKHLIWVYF